MLTASELSAKLGAIMSDLAELLDSIEATPEVDRTPGDAQKLAEEGRCLFCTEPLNREGERAKPLRGLHYACYQVVKRRISEKRMTDEDAEKKGWILKAKPTGRPRKVGRIDDAASVSLATAAALLKTVDEEGRPKPPKGRKKKGK